MRRSNILEFKDNARRVHGSLYNYDLVREYKNNHTKTPIVCRKHGVFWQKPNAHLMGQGCRSCHHAKLRESVLRNPIPPRKTIPKKYNKIENFFEVPCKTNSYWAGFIAADGNLFYGVRKRATLTIALHSSDRCILELFVCDTAYTGPIADNIYNDRPRSTVRVNSSHKWLADLNKNWNLTPKKTLTLNAPFDHGPENNLAFIVGYIDGDGCFYKRGNRNGIGLKIVGTKSILEWIKDTIDGLSGHVGPVVHKCSWANAYQYIVSKRDTMMVLAQHVQRLQIRALDRKWQKLFCAVGLPD